MHQKPELKPCPLCGGEAKQIAYNRVACKKCGLRTVQNQSFRFNQNLWNTRYADERISKLETIEKAYSVFMNEGICVGLQAMQKYISELKAGK